MRRADTLHERLASLFAPARDDSPRWRIVEGPGEVIVEEQQRSGFAEIRCRFPARFRVVSWRHTEGDFWPIKGRQNADGSMLVVRPDGMLEAHVMECKHTISSSEWKTALGQLEWTLIRLLAIAGALHERVDRAVLYTAFRTDKLSLDESVDPELFKVPLEENAGASVRRDLSWGRSDVPLPGWALPFRHEKVQKDDQGRASIDLCLGPE